MHILHAMLWVCLPSIHLVVFTRTGSSTMVIYVESFGGIK